MMSGTNKQQTAYEQFHNEHPADMMNNYHTPVPQVVVHGNQDPRQTFTVESQTAPKWSWCSLVTAVFSLCCCQVFGIIATLTAVLAYVDHKAKDFERSKNKKNIAYGFGIAGIVIGSLVIVAVIISVSVAAGAAVKSLQNIAQSQDNDDLQDKFGQNVNDFFREDHGGNF